ncbi:MAG: cytoplasmic protein [Myxococcales bacterium]|nr:cytoplasmic protein [Myxococcales bacterium]
MVKKAALFAFNGEPMCFVHVLLNAFDLKERDYAVTIVIEGSATKLIKEFQEHPEQPFAALYFQARDAGLIDCACLACATKMGAADSAREQGIELRGEMKGHPSIGHYLEHGYEVFTF